MRREGSRRQRDEDEEGREGRLQKLSGFAGGGGVSVSSAVRFMTDNSGSNRLQRACRVPEESESTVNCWLSESFSSGREEHEKQKELTRPGRSFVPPAAIFFSFFLIIKVSH